MDEDTHFHLSRRRGLEHVKAGGRMHVRGNYVKEKQLHVYE